MVDSRRSTGHPLRLGAGGKPSTWLPPGRLVEHLVSLCSLLLFFCWLAEIMLVTHIYKNSKNVCRYCPAHLLQTLGLHSPGHLLWILGRHSLLHLLQSMGRYLPPTYCILGVAILQPRMTRRASTRTCSMLLRNTVAMFG